MIRTRLSIGSALLWLLTTALSAAEPADAPGYVLLRDLAVLRGTVEEEPGRVIIRNRGAEIRLPRERVACWADSLDALYQYQLDRRRIFNLETHLDAARWCLRHGLRDRAEAELVAAGRLQPEHPELKRAEAEWRLAVQRQAAEQVDALKQELSTDSTPGTAPAVVADGPPREPVGDDQAQVFDQQSAPQAAALLEGISESQLREFNVRVQPLLGNRCGATACHGAGSSTAWVLHWDAQPGRRPSAATTRENLASAIRWISRDQPSASPLLVRALEPHGGSEKAPLGAGDELAIENLRQWILSLASEQTPLARIGSGGTASPDISTAEVDSTAGGAQPVRLPDVADPFDPDVFNRRFHRRAGTAGRVSSTAPR